VSTPDNASQPADRGTGEAAVPAPEITGEIAVEAAVEEMVRESPDEPFDEVTDESVDATDGVRADATDGVRFDATGSATYGEADGATGVEEPDLVEAPPALSDPAELDAALEAILFVVDTPLDAAALAATLQVPVPEVDAGLGRLRSGYDERGAGIELREAAGGVRLYTRSSVAPHVERFLQDGQRSRLSQAALETLAVIAYRQPVTRSRVSAIRGVNVDGVVRTLLSRGLIVEVGTEAESGAGLFRTTELFLERMGMQSLDELPSLAPLLPELSVLEHDELSS
jgi:segregation and condensation protein B